MWHIYKITCSITGKSYIGISKLGSEKRFRAHKKIAADGKGHYFHSAIRKYGEDNFSVEVITECCSFEEAIVCERAQIAQHGTFVPSGYNLTSGGEGLKDFKQNPAAVAQMVEKHKNNPEWRKNLSKAKKGIIVFSEQHKTNQTEGTRRRRAREKTEMTPEQRAAFIKKCSDAKKGKKFSEEHKRKLSEARKRLYSDPATRERMLEISSSAGKEVWNKRARGEIPAFQRRRKPA